MEGTILEISRNNLLIHRLILRLLNVIEVLREAEDSAEETEETERDSHGGGGDTDTELSERSDAGM